MHRVLVADDEAVVATHLEERLGILGYNVVGTAFSGSEALNLTRTHLPDIALLDIVMPGDIDGVEAARVIKTEYDIPVIFITGYASDELIDRAKKVSPDGYLMKPFLPDELKAAIEIACHRKKNERSQRPGSRRMKYLFEKMRIQNQELREKLDFFKDAAHQAVSFERALWDSHEQFKCIVEESSQIIAEFDDELNVLYANTAFKKFFNLTDIENLSFIKLIKMNPFINNESKTVFYKGESYRIQGIFSGQEQWLDISLSSYTDSLGKKRTILAGRDVTALIDIETRLRKSEAYFKAITENSTDLVLIANPDSTITYCNHSSRKCKDKCSEGRLFLDFIHEDDRNSVKEQFETLENKGRISFEARCSGRKSSEKTFIFTVSNCVTDENIGGYLINGHDITELKELERENIILIEELTLSLSKIKALTGIIPICSSCKKIRNAEGNWEQFERYVQERSDTRFSHGICPECIKKLYPDYCKD